MRERGSERGRVSQEGNLVAYLRAVFAKACVVSHIKLQWTMGHIRQLTAILVLCQLEHLNSTKRVVCPTLPEPGGSVERVDSGTDFAFLIGLLQLGGSQLKLMRKLVATSRIY